MKFECKKCGFKTNDNDVAQFHVKRAGYLHATVHQSDVRRMDKMCKEESK